MSPQGVAQGRLGASPICDPLRETGGAPGGGRDAESLALGEREVVRLACLRSRLDSGEGETKYGPSGSDSRNLRFLVRKIRSPKLLAC